MKSIKNVVKSLKDPNMRKAVVFVALNSLTVYFMFKAGFDTGVNAGSNAVIKAAENMTPGFTEQLQKYVSATKYGKKG